MSYKNFDDWAEQVPAKVKADSLWNFELYRKSLFLSDLAWQDSGKMLADPRGKSIAQQLTRSAGSIAANIEEGYGRGYGKDYARFLRIALGSARETKGWYFRGRQILDEAVVAHRLDLIDDIIAGLVITAEQQRRK
ncbi:MAG: hypothetical protein FOGNACKC_00185 [Anaerolineae bacterium]|nr:hypothetical protein [Anaerolineae bacterium]